jgi:signal transduction histidine kinase
MLEVALDELDRLSRIVARMLLIAELENDPPALQSVDLAPLLAEAAAARSGVHVSSSTEERVEGNETLLLLALDELLVNSLDRSLAGEPVLLAGSAREGGIEISVSGLAPAGAAVSSLFDCFARAEQHRGRSSGGPGLGLAIVRAVAHAHGGRCGVRGRDPQLGTVWWLWLPADDA